jgi:hypothetical protein
MNIWSIQVTPVNLAPKEGVFMTLAWDKEPVLEAWMTNWIHVLPVAGVLGRDVPGIQAN